MDELADKISARFEFHLHLGTSATFNDVQEAQVSMAPKDPMASGPTSSPSKKRKRAPQSSPSTQKPHNTGREAKRHKTREAHAILTQSSDAALSNGELDLKAFLKAREFEIKALEDGLRRSKGALTERAFQQLPRDMRRRAASHNVKRIPRRWQKRALNEMKVHNTPTLPANNRKPGNARGRIRAETAKKLGLLRQKRHILKTKAAARSGIDGITGNQGVIGRTPRPKTRRGELNVPPKPLSKFRKRQIHKTWLPTHIYHAKRAKMTEPKKPLWRMAIPLTPSQKCYRPTHRAGGARGALCWDMSYMSTVGLEGTELALEKLLRAVGVTQDGMWSQMGAKWRQGKRSWSGWMSREENGLRKQVAPVTVVWCHAAQADSVATAPEDGEKPKKPHLRQVLVRVHPAAFLELWNVLLRLSKMQRPQVQVEDLRFEIGSIELTGPNSTEALLGVLHQHEQSEIGIDGHAKVFKSLDGVTNAASLPSNALLTFSIMDPRLRYPQRKSRLPRTHNEDAAFSLLETLTQWPADQSPPSPGLFDRDFRFKATRLPSQKSINRRKAAAPPGEYPSRVPADQPIPIILYASRTFSTASQGTWTLLAPWKCILPIWYCLVHYPLSSGGNPRFGGLQELQQICFEHGKPWFPGDYPGTEAGWAWEMDERQKRKDQWERRPKGRRAEFQSLDLGAGRKGEIGLGWACDFETLLASMEKTPEEKKVFGSETAPKAKVSTAIPPHQHLSSATFSSLLSHQKPDIPSTALATVNITLFSRGVPQPCARIYRLPSASPPGPDNTINNSESTPPSLRAQWLALAPSSQTPKSKSTAKATKPRHTALNVSSVPPAARSRALAESLLQTPSLTYPADPSDPHQQHPIPPSEDDLIGFVTTGNFSLAQGKGTAVGSLLVSRVLESFACRKEGGGMKEREKRMCIVRNAGEGVGRLGVWEVV